MKQEETNIAPLAFEFGNENITKHPNILIAASLWDKDRFKAAKICYRFMRSIDDLIDDHKAKNGCFLDGEKRDYENQVMEWISCLGRKGIDNPFLEEVTETIEKYNIPLRLFNTFAKSMIYDIYNEGFPTYQHFLDYAEGASVAPASIFVHLCCLNKEHTGYVIPNLDLLKTARPCAIFSYIVHIIRDFENDFKENLNYFSDDLLDQNRVNKDDLYKAAYQQEVPDGFRDLITQYCMFAEAYRLQTINQINILSSHLSPRYLLSLQVIYELYHLVFQRIQSNPQTYSSHALNPTTNEILDHVSKLKVKLSV